MTNDTGRTLFVEAQSIAYIFESTTTPVFREIDVALGSKIQFLVGRNGIGKSLLAAILAGRLSPSEGVVNHFGSIGYLPQHLEDFSGTGAEILGVASLLSAYSRVLSGDGDAHDYDLASEHWNFEADLKKLLDEAGLPERVLTQPFDALSGGERTRLCLATLKRRGHDFLILDEPSNHLDREGRRWLVEWITSLKGVLVVSHDPFLLRNADAILELSGLGLKTFRGALDVYLAARQQLRESAEKKQAQTQKQLKEARQALQAGLEQTQRRRARGKKAASESNQSKVILGKNKGRSEQTQARVSRIHAERIATKITEWHAAKTQVEIVDPQAFIVASPETNRAATLLSFRSAVLPYGREEPISFDVGPHDRVAVTGPNGSGKSTLLKVAMGQLSLLHGTCQVTKSVSLLDQHVSLLDPKLSALQNMMNLAPGWSETNYRTILANLRLRGDFALHPVHSLSGGERLRVALACLFSGPTSPALLLLDEPENHIDMDSKDLLKSALLKYGGGIVLVSHDDEFIEDVGVEWQWRMS